MNVPVAFVARDAREFVAVSGIVVVPWHGVALRAQIEIGRFVRLFEHPRKAGPMGRVTRQASALLRRIFDGRLVLEGKRTLKRLVTAVTRGVDSGVRQYSLVFVQRYVAFAAAKNLVRHRVPERLRKFSPHVGVTVEAQIDFFFLQKRGSRHAVHLVTLHTVDTVGGVHVSLTHVLLVAGHVAAGARFGGKCHPGLRRVLHGMFFRVILVFCYVAVVTVRARDTRVFSTGDHLVRSAAQRLHCIRVTIQAHRAVAASVHSGGITANRTGRRDHAEDRDDDRDEKPNQADSRLHVGPSNRVQVSVMEQKNALI